MKVLPETEKEPGWARAHMIAHSDESRPSQNAATHKWDVWLSETNAVEPLGRDSGAGAGWGGSEDGPVTDLIWRTVLWSLDCCC